MAFIYSYNKQVEPNVIFDTIIVDIGVSPLFIDYNEINYNLDIYFENQLTGQQETDLNVLIADYNYVDTNNYASFVTVYASSLSATTLYSGATDLYNIFSKISNSGETNTVSNIGTGFGIFKQKSGVDFQFRTLSAGTNISFATGDTLTLNVTNNGRVQPGTNITTGGTENSPIINLVASPSINNLSFSGTATGGNVYGTTISGGTLYSGSTNISSLFGSLSAQQVSQNQILTKANLSGSTFTGGVIAPSLSATTISGGTLYSGGTNLHDIFLTAADISATTISAGSNINVQQAEANAYSISTVASPSINNLSFSGTATGVNLSATTISGGTLYSGSTNLYNIFLTAGQLSGTSVSAGANISVQQTGSDYKVSTVASPSINNLSFSGTATGVSLSATTISGGTLYSGSTNISSLFGSLSAQQVSQNQILTKANLSGSTFTGGVIAPSLSATTISGGTLYSGSTNLYSIFATIGSGGGSGVNNINAGSNITTGGTASSPIISVVASPSFNNINFSGTVLGGVALSASSISGYTLFLKDTDTAPATPATGATAFVKDKANRKMFGQVGPSGLDYTFQPALYGNKVALWVPPGNSTTVPGVLGIAALAATGTATARNVATTNMLTRARRIGVVSANPAGSLAGYRNTVAQYTIGNGSGLGGFMFVIRFGVADAQTATRTFIGLRNSTGAPTNVSPSIITNCIGVGNTETDSNFFIYYGGSAAQTPIDLGVNFPCNTNSQDIYELTLFSSPNSNNTIGYRVERLNTGDIAQGVITGTAGTQIPSSTTFLTMNTFRTNNANTGVVALDYVSIYFETDN